MQSAPVINVSLTRSVWCLALTAVAHLLAALAWLLVAGTTVMAVSGLLLLGWNLLREWYRPWPVSLCAGQRGRWSVAWSDGRLQRNLELVSARVLPGLIGLRFGPGPGPCTMVYPDTLCDVDHSRLRRMLKHSLTGAS